MVEATVSSMNVGQVEACAGGTLVSGSRSAFISGVSIDSRTLRPGDLFFAIRGPRQDGHGYIRAALDKGAAGAVVSLDYEAPADFPADKVLLRVADTHRALIDLAASVRKRWQGSLIGITGSMGKTTTKEFSAHVLEIEYVVYRSPGNFNNLFGLPLAICELSWDHNIGIFEMGMSSPGEIAEMCRIAHPAVGVITNVAPVHLEFFGDIGDIARAKSELAQGLGSDGTLVYNADDPLVNLIGSRFEGIRLAFGTAPDAHIRADDIEVLSLGETRFTLTAGGRSRAASVPFAGWHYVMNSLPAVALGIQYRIELDRIVDSLRHLPQNPMRGEALRLAGGITVIDDSYNSNPRALRQMIEILCQIPDAERRILVAGEMLELGPTAGALHYECGALAARRRIDMLVAVRGTAREIARGAAESGLAADKILFFAEVDAATEFVLRTVRPGDLLLVKGSRGVQLDRMVKALRSTCGEWKN